MSTTNFHSPQPQATNLRQNILAYLNTLVLAPLLTAPSMSINNLSVTEGNSGTSSADFTVSLSSSYCKNVTVNYATADSSAVAGSDYLMAPSTPLTFSAGETSKVVSVPINGDVQVEPNETFFVNLSAAVSATISDGQGVGTINNDDTAGASVSPISSNTTEAGGTATFSVVLNSQPSADVNIFLSSSNITEGTINPISLRFTASNYSAINPADVSLTNVSVVFQLYLPMIFR